MLYFTGGLATGEDLAMFVSAHARLRLAQRAMITLEEFQSILRTEAYLYLGRGEVTKEDRVHPTDFYLFLQSCNR